MMLIEKSNLGSKRDESPLSLIIWLAFPFYTSCNKNDQLSHILYTKYEAKKRREESLWDQWGKKLEAVNFRWIVLFIDIEHR